MGKPEDIAAPKPAPEASKYLALYEHETNLDKEYRRAGFVGKKEELLVIGVAIESMFPSSRSLSKSNSYRGWSVTRISKALDLWEVDRRDTLVQSLEFDITDSSEAMKYAKYISVEVSTMNEACVGLVSEIGYPHYCRFIGTKEELVSAGIAIDIMFPVAPLRSKHGSIHARKNGWSVERKEGRYLVTRWDVVDWGVVGYKGGKEDKPVKRYVTLPDNVIPFPTKTVSENVPESDLGRSLRNCIVDMRSGHIERSVDYLNRLAEWFDKRG